MVTSSDTRTNFLVQKSWAELKTYWPSEQRPLWQLRGHPTFCHMHAIPKHRPTDLSHLKRALTGNTAHRTVRSFLTHKRNDYCTLKGLISAICSHRKPYHTENFLQNTQERGEITATQIEARLLSQREAAWSKQTPKPVPSEKLVTKPCRWVPPTTNPTCTKALQILPERKLRSQPSSQLAPHSPCYKGKL